MEMKLMSEDENQLYIMRTIFIHDKIERRILELMDKGLSPDDIIKQLVDEVSQNDKI